MTAQPRLLFMAKPPSKVLSAMVDAISTRGLDTLLGDALFASENWHQSLSVRYFEPELCEKLLCAGARISAASFTMKLSHISSQENKRGRIHWAFQPDDEPPGFRELLNAVQSALRSEGLGKRRHIGPHVTISYWAQSQLPSLEIEPIEWTIDEILLVEGGGREPYRYRTLGRWPLLPPRWVQLRLL